MTPDDDYDWADDDTLSADEIMRIFEALGPDVEITGPPEKLSEHVPAPNELTFSYATKTKTETISVAVAMPLVPGDEHAVAWTR